MNFSFKQYLSESNIRSEANQWVKHIKHDCAPFLKQYSNTLLYRGIILNYDVPNKDILEKESYLTDRRPKDVSKKVHDTLNTLFATTFKHPYRNGVFVSGDLEIAENYGDVYIILPIGSFDYIWSPYISDMFNFLDDAVDDLRQVSPTSPLGIIIDQQVNKISDEKIRKRLLELPTGVMIKHLLYAVANLSPNDSVLSAATKNNNLLKEFYNILLNIWKELFIENKKLKRAAIHYSNHEIVLWCERYYALRVPNSEESEEDSVLNLVLSSLGYS